MSEPIFRAWDNKKQEWIEYFHISQFGNVLIDKNDANALGECSDYIDIDATLCRSTGLKDRNSVVLFEGDIVEFEPFNPEHCEGDYLPQQIFEVSLKRLRYWLKEERFGFEGELLLNSNDCEIIGNVFQNKELLEEKK